jgi:hypothetical protein
MLTFPGKGGHRGGGESADPIFFDRTVLIHIAEGTKTGLLDPSPIRNVLPIYHKATMCNHPHPHPESSPESGSRESESRGLWPAWHVVAVYSLQPAVEVSIQSTARL